MLFWRLGEDVPRHGHARGDTLALVELTVEAQETQRLFLALISR